MAVTATTDRPTKKQLSSHKETWNRFELYSGICLSFDGTNDSVTIGNVGDCMTVSCIIKPTTTTEKIIDFDGGTHVLELISGTITATGFNNPTIYIDGHEESYTLVAGVSYQVTVTTDTSFTASNLVLGLATSYYDGYLGNLVIYSTVRSSTEIEQLWLDPGRVIFGIIDESELTGHWPMIEGSGSTLIDRKNNAGAISGATWVTGLGRPWLQVSNQEKVAGKVLFSDSSANYVSGTATEAVKTSKITVASWFHFNESASGGTNYFAGLGSGGVYGWVIYFTQGVTDTTIVFGIGNGTSIVLASANVGAINDFSLHHIACTYDGIKLKIYFDGSSVATSLHSGDIDYTGLTSYTIGQRSAVTAGTYFHGLILTLTQWDGPISGSQISELYNSGTMYLPSKVVTLYDIVGDWENQGSGSWDGTFSLSYTGTKDTLFDLKTYYSKGYTKGVLQFQGNEHGELPSNSDLQITSDITVGCWVRHESLTTQQAYLAKNLAYSLLVSSAGKPIMSIYQTSNKFLTSDTILSVDTWYYIVGTYTSGMMEIYIDGELTDTSTSFTGNIDSNNNPVQLAADGGSQKFIGLIDDITLYNRVITADEIRENYRTGLDSHTN